MWLFFYLIPLTLSIAVCVVAFLLFAAGDLTKFRAIFEPKPKTSTLPLITPYGEIIATPQDLDEKLNSLKGQLRDKYQELDNCKKKVQTQTENLKKLEKFKNCLVPSRADVTRVETECGELQKRIEDMHKLQLRIQEEFCPNGGFIGDADRVAGRSPVM